MGQLPWRQWRGAASVTLSAFISFAHMGTGLPFPLEVVLLLLGLPLAFAWLFVLAGLVSLSMRHPLRKLRRIFNPRSSTSPKA